MFNFYPSILCLFILVSLQCSATCGAGEQRRRVVCQAVTKEGWILPGEVPYGCKQSEKPTATQTCDYGPCTARYRWMTGMWGEVGTIGSFTNFFH